jgi:hypothetical protein
MFSANPFPKFRKTDPGKSLTHRKRSYTHYIAPPGVG